MILDEITKGLDVLDITGDAGLDISGLSYDSRKVDKGHLFFALSGEHADGHSFIEKAVGNGAAAVVYEKPGVYPGERLMPAVTWIRVKDSRRRLPGVTQFLRKAFRSLQVIGITAQTEKLR
jgi:UDP-N-acetylmuramoyl-L-alanyl-D-glutamate--2,6-diaminopimelate ligase